MTFINDNSKNTIKGKVTKILKRMWLIFIRIGHLNHNPAEKSQIVQFFRIFAEQRYKNIKIKIESKDVHSEAMVLKGTGVVFFASGTYLWVARVN